MGERADVGRSGARSGKERKAAGQGSKDLGEPAGQMKQKSVTTGNPQRKHQEVDAARSAKAPSRKR
jgi:hypothetical protein